jgi:hypothetical protein
VLHLLLDLPDSCQGNRLNDVWYSVVVPASGSLTIETAAETGTAMTDSVLTIYSQDLVVLWWKLVVMMMEGQTIFHKKY